MWTDNDIPSCIYDTMACEDCGACRPSPLQKYLEQKEIGEDEDEDEELDVENLKD